MNDHAIELEKIEKRFGRSLVLKQLSLRVPTGSVYALLGHNGAGKSTAIRLMTGQLIPDGGRVKILGADPVRDAMTIRPAIGYVAEDMRLYDFYTVSRLGNFLRGFYPNYDPGLFEHFRRLFRLPADRKIRDFSRGMYTKTTLLTTLCRRPKLLILDDPTLGLDTESRQDFLSGLLDAIPELGCTILISSHLISELEGICDQTGIIRDGQLMVEGAVDSLKASFRRVVMPALVNCPPLPGELAAAANSRTVRCCRAPENLLAEALRQNHIESFEILPVSLEDLAVDLGRSSIDVSA